ncbi:MAG: hypothetical protein KJZ83_09660 [Burkholderiaceae bacterium]|nr:hypothetical protein [Burkholderiaceae bacterium]
MARYVARRVADFVARAGGVARCPQSSGVETRHLADHRDLKFTAREIEGIVAYLNRDCHEFLLIPWSIRITEAPCS